MSSFLPSAGAPNLNPLAGALGVQFEPYPVNAATTQAAPTSQTIWGTALYATQGAVITGVKLRNGVAAAGTLPTTARAGLADNTGKMLAIGANANALASWVTGVCPFPFSAPLTLAYSGLYFACFVVNGVWSVTQPAPILNSNSPAAALAGDGSSPPPTIANAAVTDLPAVGASVSLVAGARSYYLALY